MAYGCQGFPKVTPPSVTLRLVLTAIQAILHTQLCLPVGMMRDVFTSGTYGTLNNPQPRLAPARPLLTQDLMHPIGQVLPEQDHQRHLARISPRGVFR